MNSVMRDYYPIFAMYQALRAQLMELLTDEDLQYRAGGANPTLGALCREIGETEHAYIESFRTFRHDYSYRHPEPAMEGSVQALSSWFARLDDQLKEAVEGLSDDDLEHRVIDRGGDFRLPPRVQLEVYKEALLIFYGKTDVYLKAMGKTLPAQWQEWIG